MRRHYGLLRLALCLLCSCQAVAAEHRVQRVFAKTYIASEAKTYPGNRIDFTENAYFYSDSSDTQRSRHGDLGGGAELGKSAEGLFIKHFPLGLPATVGTTVSTGLFRCSFKIPSTLISCVDIRNGQEYLSEYDPDRGILWFELICDPVSRSKCKFNLKTSTGIFR